MLEQSEDYLSTIGENIREARKKKGLTLKALSSRSGLSAPFLSQIENARVNINLNTLNEICNALEIPIVSLFGEEKRANVRLIRSEHRQWVPLTGRSVESILVNSRSNIELCIIRLPPGENTGRSDHHPGDEVCYVMSGSVRTILDDDTVYELGENDVLYFEAEIPHRWENVSDQPTEFLVINSPATY